MKIFTALTHGALLTLALGLTLGSVAQELRGPSRQYAQATTAPDTPKSYFPGLGEFMARIQTNHAKLWLAGEARNWELAEYELDEMKEVFSDVQDFIPRYKDIPVGDMIEALMTGVMSDLESAIGTRDLAKFSAHSISLSNRAIPATRQPAAVILSYSGPLNRTSATRTSPPRNSPGLASLRAKYAR